METTVDFVQEIPSLNLIDENFPGLATIEQNVNRKPSFPVVLETEKHKESNAAILDIENALGLIIKVEPEIDDYGSENVPLEVAKNIYARECIKQEQKCMVESRNNEVTKLEQNLVDNLDHLSDSALDEFKEYRPKQEESLVKIETNYFEEMHEVDFNEWKIKNEDVNIKEDLEGNEASISPDCANQDNTSERRTPKEGAQFGDEISFKNDHCIHKTILETSYSKGHEVDWLKCHKCDFQTKYKHNLKTHLSRHISPGQVGMFKCHECNFQTKHKKYLKPHLLRHSNSADGKKFKCDQCYYKSIYKQNLERHLLRHKNIEEVELFKCDKCDFQTKYKDYLKRHLHDTSGEVQMFKCNQCDFQTKYKNSLETHWFRHISPEEVGMFKCNECDFQTTHKRYLKPHLLHHSNSAEGKKFKCDQCSYKTIYKQNLERHILRHKNIEEVEMFKCDKCDFQTKYKDYLKTHLHDTSGGVEMFKCNHCDFQTKYKNYLKVHLLQHSNSEHVKRFNCDQCSFITNFKASLNRHRLQHMNPESRNLYVRSMRLSN